MTDLLCQVHGMRATALLAAGQVDRARVELDAFAAARDKPYVSGVLNDLDADDTLAALAGEELVRRVYGELQAADQVLVSPTGSADRIRGALALRLGLVDEAEAHYRTGLEWSERERCVLETGRTLQGLAEVAERRGDHATAMEHLDRAPAIFSNCGAKLFLDQVLAKKEILKA
jgi:tetratricopeptide (TPR) repeat protein